MMKDVKFSCMPKVMISSKFCQLIKVLLLAEDIFWREIFLAAKCTIKF